MSIIDNTCSSHLILVCPLNATTMSGRCRYWCGIMQHVTHRLPNMIFPWAMPKGCMELLAIPSATMLRGVKNVLAKAACYIEGAGVAASAS